MSACTSLSFQSAGPSPVEDSADRCDWSMEPRQSKKLHEELEDEPSHAMHDQLLLVAVDFRSTGRSLQFGAAGSPLARTCTMTMSLTRIQTCAVLCLSSESNPSGPAATSVSPREPPGGFAAHSLLAHWHGPALLLCHQAKQEPNTYRVQGLTHLSARDNLQLTLSALGCAS